jgi:hypothetical protein
MGGGGRVGVSLSGFNVEKPPEATVDLTHQTRGDRARELDEVVLVDGRNLRCVRDRIPREPRRRSRQQRIAWRGSQRPIAREHADHDGCQPTGVDLVALNHERGVPEPGFGATRLRKVDPPDLSAANQRRNPFCAPTTALERRRKAAAPGSSPGCPPFWMARFHASVASTDSEPSRSRNSRTARARRPLLESLRARALASSARKRSSGNEIAVFTP